MDTIRLTQEAGQRLAMICGSRFDILDGYQRGEVPMFFPPHGLCRTAKESELQRIHAFEEKYGAVVYAVLAARWAIGIQDAFLYVDCNERHWAYERSALCHEGRAHAYIDVYDNHDYNEFATVRFVQAVVGPVWVFP